MCPFRSRLIYESFSDSSRDVDLVSQEILLSDLRFVDCAANKRSNVFTQGPFIYDVCPEVACNILISANGGGT